MVTVIMVCWRRFDNLERIIQRWLDEPEVTEFILWDNSGQFETNLPVILINCSENMNPSVRYSIAAMAKENIIVNADDDLLPEPGVIHSLLAAYSPYAFVGVAGLRFHGTNSFFDYDYISGNDVQDVEAVDCVSGPVTMTHKENLLGWNYSELNVYHLELHLQGLAKVQGRNLRAYVPPVKYIELEESRDENALYLKPEAREAKDDIYRKYFKGCCKYL